MYISLVQHTEFAHYSIKTIKCKDQTWFLIRGAYSRAALIKLAGPSAALIRGAALIKLAGPSAALIRGAALIKLAGLGTALIRGQHFQSWPARVRRLFEVRRLIRRATLIRGFTVHKKSALHLRNITSTYSLPYLPNHFSLLPARRSQKKQR